MSLNDSSTWAPNESAAALWVERSQLSGNLIGAVAYGVHATLFFTTLKFIVARRGKTARDYLWLVYVVALFSIGSVGNGLQFKAAQLFFIDYRNFPGPLAGWQPGTPILIAGDSLYIINGWLQDALLLYRFRIIVGGSYLLLAFPVLLFLTTVAVGCAIIGILCRPISVPWPVLLTANVSISVGFNIILTLSIVAKLFVMRRQLGRSATALSPYVSISAMLVESAALYSVVGVILVIGTGLEYVPLQNLTLPVMGQILSIGPMLIIMRVAQGRAWSAETEQRLLASSMTEGGRDALSSYPLSSVSNTHVGTSIKVDRVTWTNTGSQDAAADKSFAV